MRSAVLFTQWLISLGFPLTCEAFDKSGKCYSSADYCFRGIDAISLKTLRDGGGNAHVCDMMRYFLWIGNCRMTVESLQRFRFILRPKILMTYFGIASTSGSEAMFGGFFCFAFIKSIAGNQWYRLQPLIGTCSYLARKSFVI